MSIRPLRQVRPAVVVFAVLAGVLTTFPLHANRAPADLAPQAEALLAWHRFLNAGDTISGLAVDRQGDVVAAGRYYPNSYGKETTIVVKMDRRGQLLWQTELGGNSTTRPAALTLDTAGNVYVTGMSTASWGTPIRLFSVDPTRSLQCYVAKLDRDGVLQWNTFLGPGILETGAIAADRLGNVIVLQNMTGTTWGNPINPMGTANDASIARLSTDGALEWNTFLGGSDSAALAVDANGDAYLAASANHPLSGWGEPVVPLHGNRDVVVAKLSTTGAPLWNTFVGGAGNDYRRAVSVDAVGAVYLAGGSEVSWGTPVAPYAGTGGWVAKLDTAGQVQWNTFVGATGVQRTYGVSQLALDAGGRPYVAGTSYATWGTPVRPYSGSADVYVAALETNGTFRWNTFLGGSGGDESKGIGVDAAGGVFVAGNSTAPWGAPLAGSSGAFVAALGGRQRLDLNEDGYRDVLWRRTGAGGDNAVWYLGAGSASRTGALTGNGPTQPVGDAVAPAFLGSASVYAVTDPSWDIACTGDFDGDGTTDLVWRNSGTPDYLGWNLVWFMNRTTVTSWAPLPTVTDPAWRMAACGDINGDGWPDIVWRNTETPGWVGVNIVWYLTGTTLAGFDYLYTVPDPSWRIAGMADFNGDGHQDLLWRSYGGISSGMNVVWYMNGASPIGYGHLPDAPDTTWEIEGAGDYNFDGWPDLVWRNYGTGGDSGANVIWYMQGMNLLNQVALPSEPDLTWRMRLR